MVKTRFSSVDIRTTVHNLQRDCLGLRLANLYDLSPRVFLLKLSRPDFKKSLIIESGIRIHSTNFIRDKGDHTPAPFSVTLRKYLKTKRLESVKQIGIDRIVDFTFGSGIATQHLIVELFSIGNVILTDGDYKVLAILRTHQFTENDNIAVGDTYPVDKAKQPSQFTTEFIEKILDSSDKKETLKQVFNKSLDFGPELIEHCLLSANLQPSLKLESYDKSNNDKFINSLKEGQKIFDVAVQSKGYIVLRPPKVEKQPQHQKKKETTTTSTTTLTTTPEGEEKKELIVYDEFVPYLYKQYQEKKYIEFETFDHAVDKFFSDIESQKVEQQRLQQEQTVIKKLDKVKEDQQRRVDSLFAAEAENIRKAQLIESNLKLVDQCILIIRSAVRSQMDWTSLNQLLKEEKKMDPTSVAQKIHKLKLETNQITLALNDPIYYVEEEDEEEEEEEEDEEDDKKKKSKKQDKKPKPVLIDVDIGLTAFANARSYYDTKKQSHEKAEKTIQQADFALKAAEKKARQQLSEVKAKASMIQMRKVFWFEKFHWFLSSDNYIVISGKDAQQNELLYKKYLEKDDIYVHADIFGSTSCVIKNPKGGEVPPTTLIQAGTMTMCYSNAWSAKVVTSAYWVYSNQVSKTAPSGEYLTTGSFMIRGKKNYLPHSQLVMGFGFMFKIDDTCIGNHIGERSGGNALTASNDGDLENEREVIVDGGDSGEGGKHLRKFERAKLKKELEEQKFMEIDGVELSKQITNLNVDDSKSKPNQTPVTTTTSTSTTDSTTTTTPSTADKYKFNLITSFGNDESDSDEEKTESKEPEKETQPSNKKSTPYLSAAEKRKLKKAKESKDPKNNNESAETTPTATTTTQEPKPKEKKVKNEPQVHLKPSQKNKLKKIQEKYGDQDEDERREKMEILGSAGAKKDKKKDKKDKKNKHAVPPPKPKDGKQQPQQQQKKPEQPKTNVDPLADITKTAEKPVDQEKPSTTTTEPQEPTIVKDESSSDESESEGEGESNTTTKTRKSRKEKREEKLKEQEEIKKILEEENETKLDSETVFSNIDTLTGCPVEGDILHFAIPVVGPYTIFSNYKYKVKLTPGHQKRGKAAKAAAAVLLTHKDMTSREKELIKNIKDEDLSANMLADVRLHAPNLLASKKKEKAEKKEKAKAAEEQQQAKKEKKQQEMKNKK